MPTATKRSTNGADNDSHLASSKKPRRGNAAAATAAAAPAHNMSISIPHPLNVKPAGNALFASQPSNRHLTLGSIAVLSDELIMHILTSYDLSPLEIATLSQVSRGMRAFANSEGLWRGMFVESQLIGGRMQRWTGSWKQTVGGHLRARCGGAASVRSHHLAPTTPADQQPFYSDVLYLPHRLSLLPLDRYVNNTGKTTTAIQRIPASTSLYDFHTRFASQNTPVIIECPEQSIPGLGTTISDLQSRYGEQWVRAEALQVQVKTYADYARCCETQQRVIDDARRGSHSTPPITAHWYDPATVPDESPYYLFDSELPLRMANDDGLWTVPEQIKHCPDDVYGVRTSPQQVDQRTLTEADLFSLLSTSRPDWRWLIAGPTRSGSNWHKDPNLTSAWNTPLSGVKFWMMLPPDITPPGVFLSDDGADITTPVSLIEWLNDFYNETKHLHGITGSNLLLEGKCGPGETVYVPSGWWHLVVNLSESVALTQNFVSLAELPQVLDFMKNNSNQISGFKFGPAQEEDPHVQQGQIDPRSTLYDDFVARLTEYDEALVQWALKRLSDVEETRVRVAKTVATKKKNMAEDAHGATWWEKLKSGGVDDDDGAPPQAAPAFALDSLVDGEDLDDVPW